jgi:dipeptidyl aminopeptidase/acylaminoacyl peptidase
MNKVQLYFLLTALFLLLTVACNESVTPGELAMSTAAAETGPRSLTPTATVAPPSPTQLPDGDSELSRPLTTALATVPTVSESAPTSTLDPEPAAEELALATPPAGLLVALGSRDEGWALLVAGPGGGLQTLVEQVASPHYWPDFDVSPDGRQLLYAGGGEIWRLDISSGTTENVTQTPGRVEQTPRWLPGQNGFVCGSELTEAASPFPGYLTLVRFDGHYEVLVEEGALAAPPAPSPDGETIAYTRSHQRQSVPFLYRLGSGETPVDLARYDLSWVEKSWEASWSPDGRQLAWGVAGGREGQWQASEVLLNPADGTHILLHSYQPVGIGGYIPAPRWAPDSSWLTFTTLDEQREGQGIWRVDLQSGLKEQLSTRCVPNTVVRHPAVSPDGKWIASSPCGGNGVGLIDVDSAAAVTWDAPAEVAAVGWAVLATN